MIDDIFYFFYENGLTLVGIICAVVVGSVIITLASFVLKASWMCFKYVWGIQ